jgi:predicted glycogen debranching enzyme
MNEWLEADGLGGFASGTVEGVRTRRYHALLLTATRPPVGRMVLVNGLDASLSTGEWLSAQRYEPGVTTGRAPVVAFAPSPWPTWTFELGDGSRVVHEIFVVRDGGAAVLSWRLVGGAPRTLTVRPFLSGRDYHALHHQNAAFRFEAEARPSGVRWAPYDGVPGVHAIASGEYRHEPCWYRGFRYEDELARGLDCVEDLASPGTFRFELGPSEALLVLAADGMPLEGNAVDFVERARAAERERRARFANPLHRAADAYLVRRGAGRTLVAGYPWFADWGRDTFIALRGLCLATGRHDDARSILVEWAGAIDGGMLPNRFPDGGEPPEYNSVDAALWYVICADAYLCEANADHATRQTLVDSVHRILTGYARGTRYGIGVDEDGLLRAGAPGVQLTWMDARVGERVITPRIGKPVEIEALWLNALVAGVRWRTPGATEWRRMLERGHVAFVERFWNEERGCLFDVVDVDHVRGAVDASLRPNQIFAVGGLPLSLLDGAKARSVLAVVERELWTPRGLRTLARGEPGYAPRYEGGPAQRDAVYHQGATWPWLLGAFVEAWVRVHHRPIEARTRFVAPLIAHLVEAGLGHVSELADAEPPHPARGCPFQAWSLAELIRLDHGVLTRGTEEKQNESDRDPSAATRRVVGRTSRAGRRR